MATHLYPQEGATAISPGYATGWENTASALRSPLLSTPYLAGTTVTIIASTGVASDDVLHRQLICGPWAAQDVSGTFRMVARAREDNAAVDARVQLALRAFALDGSTVLATPIDFDTAALSNEIGTSYSVRRFPRAYPDGGTTISATLDEPFYFVIEVGFRNHGTNTSTCRLAMGGNNGSDLSETIGDTVLADAWLEFSQTLVEYTAPTGALSDGHLHIGKYITGEPLYTIENEIISHDEIDEGQSQPNVVLVDGQEHSWVEYSRSDLVARDQAVNAYFDVPELTTGGAVRQRALEEIQQARATSSPGGEISGPLVLSTTRMDPIFWIDADGDKYQTRIEGKSVNFSQGVEPFQRAMIDTGAIIFCPPEEEAGTLVARDMFDRDAQSGLGTALLGGDWVIY